MYTAFTMGDNVFIGDAKRNRNELEIDAAIDFAQLNKDKNLLLGKALGGTDISGGENQKLAIARAYYRNKDCMFLDEPT